MRSHHFPRQEQAESTALHSAARESRPAFETADWINGMVGLILDRQHRAFPDRPHIRRYRSATPAVFDRILNQDGGDDRGMISGYPGRWL